MSIKIKDIPLDERPRERLINHGVSNLSTEELLAIIIKNGTKNVSSKMLATEILSKTDGLKNTEVLNYDFLKSIKGIGSAKACDIVAAIELGKRISMNIKSLNGMRFNNSSLVFDYYKKIIGDKKQEYFYAIYLDSSKKVIKDKVLFVGTLNHSIVHPREVFKEAYLLSASSFICVHNHPSGNVFPSKEDIEITKQLKEIGLMMGVPLVDHIIIGIDKYYSFFENGDI